MTRSRPCSRKVKIEAYRELTQTKSKVLEGPDDILIISGDGEEITVRAELFLDMMGEAPVGVKGVNALAARLSRLGVK